MAFKLFRQMLEEGYSIELSYLDSTPMSRHQYLSDYIFDFTTYDSAISSEMAKQALTICKVINERSMLDYISDPIQYRSFIYYCNLPFFISKLDWGGSIRFPWWDHDGIVFNSTGLWLNGQQIYDEISFSSDEWKLVINDMLVFSES